MRLPGRPGPPEQAPSQDSPADGPGPDRQRPVTRPLYPRMLRLRHVHPNAWQRAVFGEGALAVGVLLAMADLASAWTVVVLPVAVAAVVKAHDLLQGLLEPGADAAPGNDDGAGPPEGIGAVRAQDCCSRSSSSSRSSAS